MTSIKSVHSGLCRVAPSPEVAESIAQEAERVADTMDIGGFSFRLMAAAPEGRHHALGFNDGSIYPPERMAEFSMRTGAHPGAPALMRSTAVPLPRGEVRLAVLLVDFADNPFQNPDTLPADLEAMLFSNGTYPTGSLNDFYREASGGKVWFSGTIAGPYRAPQPYTYYTDGRSGTGSYPNNTPRLVEDVVKLADPDLNYAEFDPNGDGYVDGLILVHAGPGAESVMSAGERKNAIWSHKWTTSVPQAYDGVNIYAYLTVPEQSTMGVWAHELGHLIFGWPDLYDTDYSSKGLGDYCVMAGGSWNNGGRRPALPCAWCKVKQEWVEVNTLQYDQDVTIAPVESAPKVYKLWAEGKPDREYFLLENRQSIGFDGSLPDHGLAIYHVDDAKANNSQESHYMVGLEQADGQQHLEKAVNSGDSADMWPEGDNTNFDAQSTPSSNAYNGALSFVSVREITQVGGDIQANILVGVPEPPTPPTPPPDPPGPGTEEQPGGCAELVLSIMRAMGWIK